MVVRQLFDEKLAQYSYLVGCPATGAALVIDPQRDVDRYFELAEKNNLHVIAAADTHIHADYLSGLRELAERGIHVYASNAGDADWKYEWLIGSNYRYRLLEDGDRFTIGNTVIEAVYTPGHTPEHLSFLIHDRGSGSEVPLAIATGDFVFVGDLGRPDLLETAAGVKGTMESGARDLYRSIAAFRRLPDFVQVWPGHGAGSACGKSLGDVPLSTVGYELINNPAILAATDEDRFMRHILDGQPEPPLYFARMKRDNRVGPRVLGALPAPRRLAHHEIRSLVEKTGATIVDTRLDRSAFMARHLPGSIYAPLDRTFPTVAGSYVEENTPIYLVIGEERLDEAVVDLVRIGLDDVAGYVTPESLNRVLNEMGAAGHIEEITFEVVPSLLEDEHVQALDVRSRLEYDEGHVTGAVNIAHTRLAARLDELDPTKTWLVYCRSGARSATASAFLKHHGFDVRYINDLISNRKATPASEA